MTNTSEVYQQALSQHGLGNLQEAERLYRLVLEREPNHAEAVNLLGTACYQMGKRDEALNFISRAISLDNTNPLFHFNLGKIYSSLLLSEEALRSFQAAIALKPNFAESYASIGNIFRATGNTEQAIANFSKAIEIKPDYCEAYVELARVYLDESNWSESEQYCRQALKLKSDYTEAYRTLGNACIAQGKSDEAIVNYQAALQINPQLAEVYWDLSKALSWKTMECQHMALELRPDLADIMTHMRLGNGLLANNAFSSAINCFRRVTQLAPNFADAYCDLGKALSMLSSYDEAIKALERAIAINPNLLKAHVSLGDILERQDDKAKALISFQQALRLNPNDPEANYGIGRLMIKQGNSNEAIAYLQTTLKFSPNLAEAHAHLASAYLMAMEYELANIHAQKALELAPKSALVLKVFGNSLITIGRVDEAIEVYKRITKSWPGDWQAYYVLGEAYKTKGRLDEAYECFEKALKIKPDDVEAIAGKASILESRREFQAGYDLLRPVLDTHADNGNLLTLFSNLSRRLGLQQEAVARLEECLSKQNLGSAQQSSILFHLGLTYDEMGEFDRAFKCTQQANNLQPSNFQPEVHEKQISDYIQAFSTENLASLPRANNDSELPVFIVGMPRSGTTLIEQILASYPQVFAAGELPDIPIIISQLPARLASSKPYPQCLESLTPELVNAFAIERLNRLRHFSDTAIRVIDKLPYNFLYLGFIALLFPKARIIHCVRNPIDTCISCYFQNFIGAHAYKYKLENLGFFYKQYERLMAHWENVLDIPILDVQYEDMVADQEGMSRKIVDFLGLEWDDDCLNFYKSKRFARTASYDQVRQPIYNKSVARYKNYEKHLEPLKAALGLA
jgi:tetratricopeptide (TPR) repeat protein